MLARAHLNFKPQRKARWHSNLDLNRLPNQRASLISAAVITKRRQEITRPSDRVNRAPPRRANDRNSRPFVLLRQQSSDGAGDGVGPTAYGRAAPGDWRVHGPSAGPARMSRSRLTVHSAWRVWRMLRPAVFGRCLALQHLEPPCCIASTAIAPHRRCLIADVFVSSAVATVLRPWQQPQSKPACCDSRRRASSYTSCRSV